MTRPTPWAHLPNAAPLDEVLTSVKAHPKKWIAAWSAARGTARDAAWSAAQDAVIALVTYDDAGQFMKLPIEQLKAMHKLDPHPMYVLLQPAAVVFMGVEP